MKFKKFIPMSGILFIFFSIAIGFSIIFKSRFYLLNFMIIGICIAFGMGLWPILPKKKKDIARKISMILVGSYMVFGLGFGLIYIIFGRLGSDNMQIEGFWFWLLAGLFAAGVMHFTIAKIAGPFLFGRSWCGWCCWTTAVLDLLPFKNPVARIDKKYEYLRYLHFILSTSLVFLLVFVFKITHNKIFGIVDLAGKTSQGFKQRYPNSIYENLFQIPEVWWFTIGNIIYYFIGIVLAFVLKDNRAFCKYVCPIVTFLKIGSRFSIIKIKTYKERCIDCKLCEKNCPMNINITGYINLGKRVLSTECIMCANCVRICPENVLTISAGFDAGLKDKLIREK